MRTRVKTFLWLLCCALAPGCARAAIDVSALEAGNQAEVYGENAIEVVGSLSPDMNPAALNFGITPWDTPENLKRLYAPMLTYIEDKTGRKVRFLVAPDYNSLQVDLVKGIIHIAAFSPGAYVDALDAIADKMIYVATATKDGREYYRGMIVARMDSPFQTLGDIRGKRFGFVEKGSSSGYKNPLALLLQQGINPFTDFGQVFFLGSHPSVTDALAQGRIEAGATWDINYAEAVKKHGDIYRVIAETEPIPYDCLVISAKLGAAFARELQAVMLSMTPATRNSRGETVFARDAKAPYSGWTARGPAFYYPLREAAKTVEKFENSQKK